MTKISEGEVCGWTSLNRQKNDVKILVPHVNVRQRVSSAEEDFNNQGDRMSRSVDTSRLLSLVNPVTT